MVNFFCLHNSDLNDITNLEWLDRLPFNMNILLRVTSRCKPAD